MEFATPPSSSSVPLPKAGANVSSQGGRRTISSDLAAWGTAATVIGLFILRFGYGFGWSDQDEFLPLIQHWIDPSLFTHDWFVMMQAGSFGIRTAFATLLWGLSMLANVELAVFVVHLGTAFAICLAVFRITERISRDRWVPVVATIAAVLVTARMNPGGNDVLHAFLVPSSLGWAAALWALYHVMERRTILAGLFMAGALWMHPLVGLQTGSVLCLLSLLVADWKLKRVWPTLLLFAASAIPLIILLSNLGAPSTPSDASVVVGTETTMLSMDPAWILTEVRAPHHYLPTSFPIKDWVVFLVLVLGTACFWKAKTITSSHNARFLRSLFLLLCTVLAGSFLVTGWPIQIPFLARLQPFHLSPFLRIVSVLLLTVGLSQYLKPFPIIETLSRATPVVMPVLGSIFLLIGLWQVESDVVEGRESLNELHAWVAESTAEEAVFAIPPSMSGFQYGTGRAQFISFKSFPFTPEGSQEWLRRLHDLSPVESWLPGGTALQERLEESWSLRTVDDMADVLLSRDIDFVVRPVPDPANWSEALEPQWCSESWCVYWAGRILMRPTDPAFGHLNPPLPQQRETSTE